MRSMNALPSDESCSDWLDHVTRRVGDLTIPRKISQEAVSYRV